jgi:hypothetical protein
MRHAIIEPKSKRVVNCVEWEGTEWLPPRNHLVVKSDVANVGDTYDENTKTFIGSKLDPH